MMTSSFDFPAMTMMSSCAFVAWTWMDRSIPSCTRW